MNLKIGRAVLKWLYTGHLYSFEQRQSYRKYLDDLKCRDEAALLLV